jgi:energy-coupling factor transporter transmembrane protein EcfT
MTGSVAESVEDEDQLLLPSSSHEPSGKSGSRRGAGVRDVVVLGLSALLLFSAFTVSQNLASTVFGGGVGFWSLGALYISFALNNFFAPSIVSWLGQKWALVAGSSLYVLFVGASVISLDHPGDAALQTGLQIASAVLLGLGSATFWTAQGFVSTLYNFAHPINCTPWRSQFRPSSASTADRS